MEAAHEEGCRTHIGPGSSALCKDAHLTGGRPSLGCMRTPGSVRQVCACHLSSCRLLA
jgi:hypothetical protein